MTDKELIAKIVKMVKNSPWKEIAMMGINAQQAQKIRAGKPVTFRVRTLNRLREKFDTGGN